MALVSAARRATAYLHHPPRLHCDEDEKRTKFNNKNKCGARATKEGRRQSQILRKSVEPEILRMCRPVIWKTAKSNICRSDIDWSYQSSLSSPTWKSLVQLLAPSRVQTYVHQRAPKVTVPSIRSQVRKQQQ